MQSNYNRLCDSDILYKRVLALSENYFAADSIGDMDSFVKEASFLLDGIKGTDAVIGIFDHHSYTPIIEVGEKEFWGNMPTVPQSERMVQIMNLLDKNYISFFQDSTKWFQDTLNGIPYEHRVNVSIFHCGIRYWRLDNSPICLFSKGLPIHYDSMRNFNLTYNYAQNIHHLLKKDFPHYWIRIAYGANKEFVHSFHSSDKKHSDKDLLSQREKEILKLVAADSDTKGIAAKLFISVATVGHHRSNMIEKIGARDSTALVQIAKMAEII